MPCWSVIRNQVELTAADPELLEKAIRDGLDWQVAKLADGTLYIPRYDAYVGNGRIDVPPRNIKIVDQIKQAYSREAVKKAAAKFGWQVKTNSENKYTVSRRY